MKKIIFLLTIIFVFTSILFAKPIFKKYPMKSGIILYDINTTGTSEGLSTHSVGISRLVFDNWGAKELREDDVTEVEKGDFNESISRRTLNKNDNGTIYSVDYDGNVTYETRDKNLDMAIALGQDISTQSIDLLKDMKAIQDGTGMVAGYQCDIWKLKDQTLCMYKGIPLKITIEAPGFISTRTAQLIMFNKTIDNSEFKLPDFPVVIDKDYTSNLAAETNTNDYIKSISILKEKAKKMGIDLNESNLTLSKDQEKEIINTLGANYLQKQKKLLPKLLVSLKGAIVCLGQSESSQDGKNCLKPSNSIDEQLGDQTRNYDFGHWNPELKNKIIEDLDHEVKDLGVTIDCVKRYNKTTKVIECTEGSLEPKL